MRAASAYKESRRRPCTMGSRRARDSARSSEDPAYLSTLRRWIDKRRA